MVLSLLVGCRKEDMEAFRNKEGKWPQLFLLEALDTHEDNVLSHMYRWEEQEFYVWRIDDNRLLVDDVYIRYQKEQTEWEKNRRLKFKKDGEKQKNLHEMLESIVPDELAQLIAIQVLSELNKPLKTVLSDSMNSIASTVENIANMVSKFFEVKK
jgi:hypothetical protein